MLLGVLIATKLVNMVLVNCFLRAEMRQSQFKQYAQESYPVLGLLLMLGLLRLKVPLFRPLLCSAASSPCHTYMSVCEAVFQADTAGRTGSECKVHHPGPFPQ